jgi:hypothetical protein
VIARLERNVRGRAAHVVARFARRVQGLDLGMRAALAPVEAFAQRQVIARQDGADARIGRRIAATALGEFVRPLQIDAVDRTEGYGRTSTPRQNATWSLISAAASLGVG